MWLCLICRIKELKDVSQCLDCPGDMSFSELFEKIKTMFGIELHQVTVKQTNQVLSMEVADMAIKALLYEHDWILAEPCRKRKLAQDIDSTENWILPPVILLRLLERSMLVKT